MERSENGGLSPARRGASPPFGHRAAVDNTAMQAPLCRWHGAVIWRKPRSTAVAWPAEHCNGRRDRVCTRQLLGLLASAIALWRTRQPRTPAVVLEALFSFFLLFSIAFANLYNFVLHVFFGKVAAAFIGWEDSPFQLEVGFASLGFAALGLLAVQGKLRSATGGHRRAGLLSMGRGRRSRLSDDYHAQFCSRQCWCHFLQRCLGSDLRLHISLATTQRSPNTSVAMRAKM
jgi:hypothetical protein